MAIGSFPEKNDEKKDQTENAAKSEGNRFHPCDSPKIRQHEAISFSRMVEKQKNPESCKKIPAMYGTPAALVFLSGFLYYGRAGEKRLLEG